MDPNSFTPEPNYYQPEEGYNMGVGSPGFSDENLWDQSPYSFNNNNPFDDAGFGQTFNGGNDQTFGNMGGGTDTEWGNISYDPQANSYDPGWGQTYDQPVATDWGNGADAYSGSSATQDGGSSTSYGDYTPPSADYDMGGAYAKGGPIENQNGLNVSPQMSPSGGQAIDDVQAQGPGGSQLRLNADEFVIPDDVAKWKGQEFFQNLIMQSRKKRMTAPAHGQQQPMR
jgi:hypothetical protein